MVTNTEDIDILKYPLKMISIVGLFSKNSKKVFAFAAVYLTILAFVLSTIFFQFINVDANIFQYVSVFEGFSGYMQHAGKVLFVVFQRKKLHLLLSYEKYCWKTNKCPKDVKAQLDHIAFTIVRLQAISFICVAVAVMVICFSTVFGRSLPLGAWLKDEYQLLRKLSMIGQVVVISPMGLLLIGLDSAFMSFCAKLIIQFRILGSCFQELGSSNSSTKLTASEYEKKLKSYIKQHIFLLRYSKTLQEMFSFIMIVEYVTISPLFCFQIYVTIESDNIETIIRYILIIATQMLQLAFYCISADYVTDEAAKIGDCLYFSDWCMNHYRSCRQPITFVMQKSQQLIIFKGAGVFEINARSLLNVLKISWSTCAVIRGLKKVVL